MVKFEFLFHQNIEYLKFNNSEDEIMVLSLDSITKVIFTLFKMVFFLQLFQTVCRLHKLVISVFYVQTEVILKTKNL